MSDTEEEKALGNEEEQWTSTLEKSVKMIGEKSKAYKIQHIRSARHISSSYSRLMYAAIFMGPLAGLLTGLNLSIGDDTKGLEVAATISAFFSGILVAITKYGEYEKKIASHKLSASRYTSLESNVRRILALPRSSRTNVLHYFEWVNKSFDELFEASPLIPDGIHDEYVKLATEKGFFVPDDYEIVIAVDEEVECKEDPPVAESNYKPDLNKYSDGQMKYELNRLKM